MPKPAPVSVDPLEALHGEVADLSRRRAELRGARETLLDAPRPPGKVRPGSTTLVERAATRFEPPLGWLAQRQGEVGGVLEHLLPSTLAPAPPLQRFALLSQVAPELARVAPEYAPEAAQVAYPRRRRSARAGWPRLRRGSATRSARWPRSTGARSTAASRLSGRRPGRGADRARGPARG